MSKRDSYRDPNAEREARRYENPIASRELLLEILRDYGAPLTYDGFVEKLNLTEEEPLEALRRRLIAMVRDGQLVKNRLGGHVIVDAEDLIRGRVTAHPDGFGFLIPDEGGDDLFLGPKQMSSLLHGDRAVVRMIGIDRRGRKEGALVEVLERANEQVVGRFTYEDGMSFVIADNKRIHLDILIHPEDTGGAKQGQIVLAAITQQPTKRHQPIGRIIEVLGDHMMPGMEIEVAINAHSIPSRWPAEVEREIAHLEKEVLEADKPDRVDLRELPLVTIDGEDSQDFDDAVYSEPRGKGWRLLVAIADVSHYVIPGTALDDEAQLRGTSVYFPGRVVPMLPEVLSNGLCSLNPQVDRLCMVCEMYVDAKGKMYRSRFFEGLMRSHARLTYTEVAKILVKRDPALRSQRHKLVPHLENLYELYHALAARRQDRGAIDFNTIETKIEFDENRKIKAIKPVERNDAHRLIEECMIQANVAAARFLERLKVPALFRIHDGPKSDKLEDLHSFLASQGLKLGGGMKPKAADYAKLLNQVSKRPDAHLFQTVLLRSMNQAVYSPKSIGHFGLSLEKYAHFTSPIRRYPDLLVHRAIRYVLLGGEQRKLHAISKKAIRYVLGGVKIEEYDYSFEEMKSLGEKCSMAERRADDATRDATDWLKCEYMLDRVGEEYEGIISSVTSFGLFVELRDIHVEGLVHVTSLSKDYYKFDPRGHRMVGERSGQVYRLGDLIKVKVARVDLDERKIDFEPLDQPVGGFDDGKRKRSRKGRDEDRSPKRFTKGGDRGSRDREADSRERKPRKKRSGR